MNCRYNWRFDWLLAPSCMCSLNSKINHLMQFLYIVHGKAAYWPVFPHKAAMLLQKGFNFFTRYLMLQFTFASKQQSNAWIVIFWHASNICIQQLQTFCIVQIKHVHDYTMGSKVGQHNTTKSFISTRVPLVMLQTQKYSYILIFTI